MGGGILTSMGLLWRSVRLSTPLAVEEVERRLAAATAGWGRERMGKPVPPPPWKGARFVASQGVGSHLLSLPLVVAGDVRGQGEGALLTASVRPRGYGIAVAVLAIAILGAVSLWRIDVTEGLFVIALLSVAAYIFLWVNLVERYPAVRDVLVDACGGSAAGLPPAEAAQE